MSTPDSILKNTPNPKNNGIGKSSFKKANSVSRNKKSVKFDNNEVSASDTDSNKQIPNLKTPGMSKFRIHLPHSCSRNLSW